MTQSEEKLSLTEEGDTCGVCTVFKGEEGLKCQHDNKENGVLLLYGPMAAVQNVFAI